ncbi:MAG: trigger factor, partial [Candidatus Saccharimonadales bacterium]
MQITKEQLSPTRVKLTITAEENELSGIKKVVVKDLGASSKVSGFRAGKAPINLIEKQLDQTLLQTEFLDAAINQLFVASVRNQALRAIGQPDIAVTKFVPFTTLVFTAEVSIIGVIKLADYKNTKLPKKSSDVTAKDVDNVLESLRARSAVRKEVKRPAKNG